MFENGADSRSPDESGWTVERAALDGMSAGVAVAGAVASHTDTDVLALDPLSEVVDIDALDGLWKPTGTGWHPDASVTFQYMGYEVTVTSDRLRLAPL